MIRLLRALHRREEACSPAKPHSRPSSISLYRLSRVPIGLRIVPTLALSVSRMQGFSACSVCRRLPVICFNTAKCSAENREPNFSVSGSVLIEINSTVHPSMTSIPLSRGCHLLLASTVGTSQVSLCSLFAFLSLIRAALRCFLWVTLLTNIATLEYPATDCLILVVLVVDYGLEPIATMEGRKQAAGVSLLPLGNGRG
jgi:hypothetical protein